jgi:YbbR domain-containing protein
MPVRSALRLTDAEGRILLYEPVFEPESVVVTGQRNVVQQLESISTVRRTVRVRDTTITVDVLLDTLRLGVDVSPFQVRATVPPPATGPP